MVIGEDRYARRWPRCGFVAALLLGMLAFGGSATAQAQPLQELEVTFSIVATLDPGHVVAGPDGIHVTGLTRSNTASGGLTGDVIATLDYDWAGPCDAEALTCEGLLERFIEVEIAGDGGRWRGYVAELLPPDGASQVLGLLIGSGVFSGQVVLLDQLLTIDERGLTFSGYRAVIGPPRAGAVFTVDMCAQADGTYSGGFLGSGVLSDSGAAMADIAAIGWPVARGRAGMVGYTGARGAIEGYVVARANGPHAYGDALFFGLDGDYAGLLGYGHTYTSVLADEACPGGQRVRSHWVATVVWTGALLESAGLR